MGIFDFLKNLKGSGSSRENIPGLINSPQKIQDHIENLCEKKLPLNLQIDNKHAQFSSFFLKDTTGQQTGVIVDPVIPSEGNRILETSEFVNISYTDEKKRFTFLTQFLGKVERKITAIKLSIPRSIDEKSRQKSESSMAPPRETPLNVRLSHLEKVCEQSVPVEVQIDNHTEVFKSIFLKVVNTESPELFIDLLDSENGNKIIADSREVILSYNFQNRHFEFDCECLGIVKKRLPALKFLVPKEIEEAVRKKIIIDDASEGPHTQKVDRRRFKRVAPSLDSPVNVFIGLEKSKREIANISVGGVAFYTSLNKKQLKVGTTYRNMTLCLPHESEKINIPKVIVRSIVENAAPEKKTSSKCAVEFFGLKISDQETIERYIVKRMRELEESKPKESDSFEEAQKNIEEF